jgi:hypothetical protein
VEWNALAALGAAQREIEVALVEDVVTDYCKQLGTVPPKPREDGIYVLHFDNKYEVEFRPAGRDQVMLRAGLPPLKRDAGRADALRRLMRINLALSDRKHSTLTLDEAHDTPFLYDILNGGPADMASNARLVIRFVNEVAAFHAALDRSRQA